MVLLGKIESVVFTVQNAESKLRQFLVMSYEQMRFLKVSSLRFTIAS